MNLEYEVFINHNYFIINNSSLFVPNKQTPSADQGGKITTSVFLALCKTFLFFLQHLISTQKM